jgi:hypothetical protein
LQAYSEKPAGVFASIRDLDVEMSVEIHAFANSGAEIAPGLAQGDRVVALLQPTFWPKNGKITMRVLQMHKVGLGELLERLERLKEGLKERLESLATRKDDLLTISEIGVDQIIVDEAQEFRKLSFATNMSTLKGIDPNGSQRAWDLYLKSRFIETKNPGRALVFASGTPITNTIPMPGSKGFLRIQAR